MQKKIKVLICDDSAVIRQVLSAFIQAAPDMELVGTAVDPYDAREKIKQLNPDVLTLDIEMPKMDGLSFLEKIMTLRPMPVIMVSTLTQRGAEATLQALETGAFDYLGKPQHGLNDSAAEAFCTELLTKIRAAAGSRMAEHYQTRTATPQASAAPRYQPPANNPVKLIAIGASTGGVEALRDVLSMLPNNLPPVVIVQHMPQSFTASFSARLNSMSPLTVALAQDNELLKPGHAYVAEGGRHLLVTARGGNYYGRVHEGIAVSGHCPSVDVMFDSVAHAVGKDALGVILTGMGKDGASGLLAMRQAGAMTLGQNEASAVVYGMPKAAFQLGAVVEQCALSKVAAKIVEYCEKGAVHER